MKFSAICVKLSVREPSFYLFDSWEILKTSVITDFRAVIAIEHPLWSSSYHVMPLIMGCHLCVGSTPPHPHTSG